MKNQQLESQKQRVMDFDNNLSPVEPKSKFASNSKYVVCFKKLFAGKVAFMNSSCFMICELNWIVFYGNSKAFSCQNEVSVFWCVN